MGYNDRPGFKAYKVNDVDWIWIPDPPPAAPGSVAVLVFGAHSIDPAPTATTYLPPGFFDVAPATIIEMVAPHDGTLKNLFVRHNTASGDGNNIRYTVVLNGVDTTLLVVLATGAISNASDLTDEVAVVQGDRIAIKAAVSDAGVTTGLVDAVATMDLA